MIEKEKILRLLQSDETRKEEINNVLVAMIRDLGVSEELISLFPLSEQWKKWT